MNSVNGTVVLNGVSDKELEVIWGYKAKHEGAFGFQPNVMQIIQAPSGTLYNNVHFAYTTPHGLNLITEVVNVLHKKEESKAVGQ